MQAPRSCNSGALPLFCFRIYYNRTGAKLQYRAEKILNKSLQIAGADFIRALTNLQREHRTERSSAGALRRSSFLMASPIETRTAICVNFDVHAVEFYGLDSISRLSAPSGLYNVGHSALRAKC